MRSHIHILVSMSGGAQFAFVPEDHVVLLDIYIMHDSELLYLKGAYTFLCCTFIDLLILLGIIHWVRLEWFTNTCQ